MTAARSGPARGAERPPRHGGPDALPRLLTEGYEFVTRGCRATGAPVFTTRLGGLPTLCMQGVEAARLFYDPDRFRREGAVPYPIRAILFGLGGVQGLDGSAHRHRRDLLRSQLPAGTVERLAQAFGDGLRARLPAWEGQGEIDLHREAGRVLSDVAHRFCGVESGDREQRLDDLQAMVVGAARLGPGRVRARRARYRVEADLVGLVRDVRAGSHEPPEGSPVAALSRHRDLDGELLAPRVVAVELLNLLRPTVAVNWFVSLAAVALHRYPSVVERLRDDPSWSRPVVQEIRRHQPFFPLVAARTRQDFTWRGWAFPADHRVLLDLYGTNHDPAAWDHPSRFDPDRFVDRDVGAHELVPQGGGDELGGHRCLGERLTIHLLEQAVRVLAVETTWRLAGRAALPRGRMPTLPRGGVHLRGVRRRVGATGPDR